MLSDNPQANCNETSKWTKLAIAKHAKLLKLMFLGLNVNFGHHFENGGKKTTRAAPEKINMQAGKENQL